MPHGLLSAHSAKICFICTQPQSRFFLAKLALQGNRKSRSLVVFPAQKKEPKWFQNLGRFKKNSSAQRPKKSPKNWTGPWLSLNMVNGNRFNKWQTPLRCQMFVSRCEPNAAQPNSAVRRPPARKTIESKRVLWGAFNLMVKKLYFQGPKI